VIHVARPEVFDNAAAPVGNGGNLNYRHVHFGLRVTEDFAKRILRLTHARKYLSFDDDFGIRRHHKFIAPGCRRCEA
jgi:hypothetical protein